MAENAVQPNEDRFDTNSTAARAKTDALVQEILDALSRLELQRENGGSRVVAELTQRVAVLEARAFREDTAKPMLM
jgi:hypothetical protein